MMKQFVWIISSESPKILKKSGVSESYIIPAKSMNGFANSICSGKIWLVIRGRTDRLVAHLIPKQLEKFIDGYNQDDYLLHVEVGLSFRTTSINFNVETPFDVSVFKNLAEGISLISDDIAAQLADLTLSTVQTKLISPVKSAFSSISIDQVVSGRRLGSVAINKINQNFNLDEIWDHGSSRKFNPFGYFAYSLLIEKVGSISDEILNYLLMQTPLHAFKSISLTSSDNTAKKTTNNRKVDLDITEINPETVFAREFIASTSTLNIEAALAKTEVAEKLHQDMLRDISVYLKSIGIIPWETTSIDLLIDHNGFKLYEIKSTNDDNLFAQSSKGAFQLAYYAEAVKKEFEDIQYALIIHKTTNELMENECVNTLIRLAIPCLIYNPGVPWPGRIQNILLNKLPNE